METVKASKNPIIPGRGVCDPHLRVFEDELYLYCSHDSNPDSAAFSMRDWQIWKSTDALTWQHVASPRPEDTFIGPSDQCWATDAVERNGKYYYYFSNGNQSIGVGVGDTPAGPFKDVLGAPLIARGSTPTMEYDPHILIDDDANNTPYIVFGGPAWAYGQRCGYYIARLAEDMIHLIETPRRIELNHRADDKAALHKFGGKYYLSWASHYAVSDSVYGPYTYRGNIGASKDHGSFICWNNQWFNAFTIYDPTGTFRATGLNYVQYGDNGDMAPVPSLISEHGVGHYDAGWNRISAAWYMKAPRYLVKQGPNGTFEAEMNSGEYAVFPHLENMPEKAHIALLCNVQKASCRLSILDENNRCVAECTLQPNIFDFCYDVHTLPLDLTGPEHTLTFRAEGEGTVLHLDSFRIFTK